MGGRDVVGGSPLLKESITENNKSNFNAIFFLRNQIRLSFRHRVRVLGLGLGLGLGLELDVILLCTFIHTHFCAIILLAIYTVLQLYTRF